MPRLPRNYLKTLYFHVMVQGINKSYIFNEGGDIETYLTYMNNLKKEYNVRIIAYCIMNNHAHLLLEVDKVEDLSKYMQKLNTKYSMYYNKKNSRTGFVFRNRFKSEGIFTEEYLYNCIYYIFNNPVKAKICKKPEKYKYSNCKEWMRENYEIKYVDKYFNFLEIDENKKERCNEIINIFVNEKGIRPERIAVNEDLLRELLIILQKNKIPISTTEKCINVNRKRLRKLILQEN